MQAQIQSQVLPYSLLQTLAGMTDQIPMPIPLQVLQKEPILHCYQMPIPIQWTLLQKQAPAQLQIEAVPGLPWQAPALPQTEAVPGLPWQAPALPQTEAVLGLLWQGEAL